jgi:exonuclease III
MKFVIFNTGMITKREMWNELNHVLSSEVRKQIVGLDKISPKRGSVRFVIKVKTAIGCVFKKAIDAGIRPGPASFTYTMSSAFPRRSTRWRIDYWRPWRERPLRPPPIPTKQLPPSGIMTINACGLKSKMITLEYLLSTNKVAICAVQETLQSEGRYANIPLGYKAFFRAKSEMFRGQVIYVHKSLTAFEVGDRNNYYIHLKVSGLLGITKPVHIIAVYLLSGGNHRKGRRLQIETIARKYQSIMKWDPLASILVLGDFNCDKNTLQKHIDKITNELKVVDPKGSPLSRFPANGKPAAIDHFLSNRPMRALIRRPRVERGHALSDHAPVILHIRKTTQQYDNPPVYRYNSSLLKGHAEELLMHNRFKALANVIPETPEDLNLYTNKFIDTLDNVSKKLGLKVPKVLGKPKFPRKLRNELKKVHNLRRQFLKCHNDTPRKWVLANKLEAAKGAFQKAKGKWELRLKANWRVRMAEPLVNNDGKKMWNSIRGLAGLDENSVGHFFPLRDKQGQLRTQPDEVLEVARAHYKALVTEDAGNSQNKEYWDGIEMPALPIPPTSQTAGQRLLSLTPEREVLIPGLNDIITWPNVLMAIRVMKRGTAAGPDELHVDVLKELLRLECKIEVQRVMDEDRTLRGLKPKKAPEGIYFALRENQLPIFPRSPLGQALFMIITRTWALEVTPDAWDSVDIISLHKSKDPELMTNYRGISLISVGLKIVLTILQARMLKGLEDRGLLVKWQAGYRKGEEAIAHYIALAEVIRRRVINNKSTIGVFVDFVKAFDRVPHEGLWKLLESKGVHGKALNLIKWIYSHSEMRIRMGHLRSEPFNMNRGNRQGCPLSPLLYIIYVNSILEECESAGLTDMREYSGLERLAGQQFADDLLGFLMDESKLEAFLAELDAWCIKWEAGVNGLKSGAMLFTTGSDNDIPLSKTQYPCGSEVIPVVTQYKYLGINTYQDLGHDGGPNESAHSIELRNKGLAVLKSLMPMLRVRNLPISYKVQAIRGMLMGIMGYGGEWIGMKMKNADRLQSVINQAVRLAMGRKAQSKDLEMMTLTYELNIPPMEAIFVRQRTRLFDKAKNKGLKIALKDLVAKSSDITSRKKTWSTSTAYWLKSEATKLQKSIDDENAKTGPDGQKRSLPPFRDWVGLGQSFEAHNRANVYRNERIEEIDSIILNLDKSLTDRDYAIRGYLLEERWKWTEEQWVRDRDERLELTNKMVKNEECPTVVEDSFDLVMERKMRQNKSKTFELYNMYGMGATRDWIRRSSSSPELTEGVYWLIRARTWSFAKINTRCWLEKRKATEGGTQTGSVCNLQKDTCPLCKDHVETFNEFSHLLVSCHYGPVTEARGEFLDNFIKEIREQIRSFHGLNNRLTEWNMLTDAEIKHQISIYLLGGMFKSVPIKWTLGFGQFEQLVTGAERPGWTYIAQFLAKVAPMLYSELYPRDGAGFFGTPTSGKTMESAGSNRSPERSPEPQPDPGSPHSDSTSSVGSDDSYLRNLVRLRLLEQ